MAKVVKAKNFVSNSAPKVVKASESFQLSQDFLEKSLKEEQNKQTVTEMIKQTGVGYNPTQAIINKTSVVDNIAKSKGYKNTAEMNRYQQNNPNLYEAMGGNKYNPIPSKSPTLLSDEGKQIISEAQKADKQYRDNLSGLQEARQKVEKSKKTYEDTKSYKGYGNVEKALNYVGGVNSNLIESSKENYEKSAAEYVAIKYHNEAAAESELRKLEDELRKINTSDNDVYNKIVSGYIRAGKSKEEAEKLAANDSRVKNAKAKNIDSKKKEIENEIDILRTALYGKYTVGQYLWENVNAGAARWNQSLSATADFTVGNVLKAFGFEDNAISKWNNWHKEELAKAEASATNTAKAVGDNKNIGGQVTQGVVMALPDLLLAVASGGTSQVAQLGPKATGLFNTVKNTVVSLAKNPSYWSSYVRELGTNYEQAKAEGATETEATLYTLLASSVNAAVEVGGGIQTLPEALQQAYKKNGLWSWFKSALEEGGEEDIQGIISGLTEKLTYNPEKEIASFTNEDAIINPKSMAKEFALGTAVGGILGGGNLAVDTVLNAKTESAYKQIGQAVLNDKNIDINGIVDYAKKSLDDGIRDLALDTNVNKITPRTVGILYKYAISDISSSINSAENIEVATKNYENIISSTQSPIINSIASSQYVLRLMENGMTEENAFAQTESVAENIQSQELSKKTETVATENATMEDSTTDRDNLTDSEADMVAINPKNTKRRHTNAKEQNYLKSVGNDLGVKVVFEDIVKVLSDEGVELYGNIPDGYIDDDGVIHIGFTVVNPTKVVFKHELTHYGEGTEAHATYTAAVEKTKLFKEWLQKKTGSNSDSVGELKGIYRDMVNKQRGSLAPKGATKLNNEMFADFSSEVLFDTDSFEQLIKQVNAKQRPQIIQYVLDFLAYLKDKLSGKKNITFELKHLESAYAAMLREATQKENTADNGGVRYSVSKDSKHNEYNSPIGIEDIEILRSIRKKSINQFESEDIQKAQKWAYKFYQQMGVKSPFFRAWFGDWRAYDKTPIDIAEIPTYIATNDARKNQRGTVVNKDTLIEGKTKGWEIRVSREGETNTISHSGKNRMSEYGLSGIRSLIENAVLFDSEVHEHHSNNSKSESTDRIAFDHKLYALGKDVDGNIALYRITVEEIYQDAKHPNDMRFHNLKYIEKVAENIGSLTADNQRAESTNDVSTTSYSISKLYDFVKKFDKEFNAGKEVSKEFLNLDGTPKKFYHGTNADFTVFDRSKSAKKIHLNVLGDGNYFTAKRQGAEKYGTNVLEVYLSVKNPYIFKSSEFNTVADQISNEYSIDRNEIKGSNVQSFLKEKNFDGVVLLDENGKAIVVNAFDSNQIKSATDNIGTFDSNNPDIRFSVPAVTEQQTEHDSDKVEQDIIKEAKELRERYNNGEISREEYREGLNDLWTDAADRFGTFPQGENVVEEIPVPKKVAKAKPTKRFIRTIIESGKLTEDMLEDVSADVLTGDFSYEVVSDESAQNHAKKLINGDTAELNWNEAVGKGIISKNEIALGEMLLVDAIERNDRVRVLELSAELADLFSRAGQAVQAAKMLKKMTGVGRLLTVQQFVRTTNKDLIEKYGDDVREVKLNPKLAEQLAETETEEDIENVYKDILVDVASQMPVTFLDKLNAWRYFSMLANPRTHIRNLLGNTIFTPVVALKNATAVAAESILIRDTSQRTKSIIIKKEYLDFAKKDIKAKETKMMLEGSGQLDTKGRVNELRRTFENEFLEKLTNGNSNLLEKEDMLFKSLHYKMALAGYLQAQKVDLKNVSENTLKAARDYAIQEAKKATFQDASVIADMLNNIRTPKSWKGKKGETTVTVAKFAVEGVLPFKRTPINIIKRGVEYSPIGLIETLTAGVYQVSKGDITISEFCDGLASGFIGSSLAAVGYLLASVGLVNGGFGDDEEDKFKQLNGEQEYSIKIGGKSYSIDWAAPACIPFFIGVELAQEIAESDGFQFSDITSSLWHILEPITNLSMLSGVQGLIDSVRYEEGSKTLGAVAGNIATSFAMQFIPSTLGATSRTIDPVQRNWYTDKNSQIDSFGQSVINNVKSKIPGLSYTMTPKIDAWGQEVSRGGVGERLAENFASPGYYSETNYSYVDNELLRISEATDKSLYPKKAAKSFDVDGKTKYLNAKEYVIYAKAKGMYSYDYIDELMANKAYKKLTDEEKAEVIKDLYEYANAKAKTTVSDYDITKSFKTVSRREENGYSPVDYYIYLALKK